MNKWVRFSGMGFQMGLVIFLGVWGGSKLDEKFPNEHKLWTIILSLLSVFIALYLVIKEVKNLSDNDDSDSKS
ncbi:MAG: AtpZ/AtpI family protein [Crocinitomicaceae bacterium]|nr:AtpZ/AtpI family protein [Crocinitomicaceae bacterium]